jgi:cation diffusion facilitator CzcD-associated flavoprotein CzcO
VIVVGAGVSGIGAACYLQANGIPYQILEASDDVGGIWRSHRWHGARCDSDFIKYAFSFAPDLPPQCHQGADYIHQYLRDVAQRFELAPHIHFDTLVTQAEFDSERKRWRVHTNRGCYEARFLLNGNGYFSRPHVPAIRGRERFAGRVVHTAELDRDAVFENEAVVLVGSGSTAICCAPELARVSGSLALVQRSPSYIYEIDDDRVNPITRMCQALYRRGIRFPVKLLRYYLQCKDDVIFIAFRRFPRFWRGFFKRHWIGTVGERDFARHFSPRYDPWRQRPTFAIGLKDQLRHGSIVFYTGQIDHFDESSMVLDDGTRLPCDVCVLATGFELDVVKFGLYVERERIAVGGLNFYKRVLLGGVPNYFHPFGTVHSAWTQSLEPGIRLAVRIMHYMRRHDWREVSVPRKDIEATPAILPNYIKRALDDLPRAYGTCELPSLDNLFSYGLRARDFKFVR